jgi:hypothetical protein
VLSASEGNESGPDGQQAERLSLKEIVETCS